MNEQGQLTFHLLRIPQEIGIAPTFSWTISIPLALYRELIEFNMGSSLSAKVESIIHQDTTDSVIPKPDQSDPSSGPYILVVHLLPSQLPWSPGLGLFTHHVPRWAIIEWESNFVHPP